MSTEHEIGFEFPYTLSGGTAAYFDCRVMVRVDWGRKPVDGDIIDEISGLEIDIGKHGWAIPDPGLARKIYDWLARADQNSFLLDKAREDRFHSGPETRRELE